MMGTVGFSERTETGIFGCAGRTRVGTFGGAVRTKMGTVGFAGRTKTGTVGRAGKRKTADGDVQRVSRRGIGQFEWKGDVTLGQCKNARGFGRTPNHRLIV